MDLIAQYEQKQIEKLKKIKEIPDFSAGDTLRVGVKIVDGNSERVQLFEGICIARRNSSIGSTFTVRKISNNEGVERVFLLYSPNVTNIEVVRRGKVRRAKLYYLRDLRGKAARIKEKNTFALRKNQS